ncbi:MAG: DUF262 domain-containing protein [Acidobacteria bacterium]|nr:DUF262 domain-containing protein [Acidobacteriota bacterium]
MKHSYPTSEPLKFMLSLIQNREMALPDFQRDFVWDPSATDELIESIISNFPAGSLLRIKNGHQLLFQPRAIEGAPPLSKDTAPSYLILDGQQRLTSLYQAFYGAGEHRYFLDLAGLEAGKDLEDCAFYLKADEAQAQFGSIEQQAAKLVFPMGALFGAPGFQTWATKVQQVRCKTMDEMLDLQARLNKLHQEWLEPVEQYEFPMVTLNENTSGEAVCTIFETLNRTGVKLGVWDLLTARFWAHDLNLRQLWEEARSDHEVLEDYDIDPYYLLQVVGLLEPGVDKSGVPKAPSIKRKAILQMNVAQAREGWDAAVEGFCRIVRMLRDDCGVLAPGLIPYNTILIPMAAVWASQRNVTGAAEGANRLKLLQWFWCSVFGQRYENAPNSQAEKDFGELLRWMRGGEEPESVVDFAMDSLKLRDVRPRQRAVYRGTMCLILQNGALDFHNRGKITSLLFGDKSNPVDDHHVFPRAYLNKREVPAKLRDCILNRTYIDRKTNRRLSKRAPSDYFGEIRKKHGTKPTHELLRSHLLPEDQLFKDDFEGFLKAREAELLRLIAAKTGSLAAV